MASEADKDLVARFRAAHDMSEVPIWSIDAPLNQLIDGEGKRFEEVETNIWGRLGLGHQRDILYLGTGKHGDRIALRALYVKVEDGRWLNAQTGGQAPFSKESMALW